MRNPVRSLVAALLLSSAVALTACGGAALTSARPQVFPQGLASRGTAAPLGSTYQAAVMATNSLAYFPLNNPHGGSVGGKYYGYLWSGARIVNGGVIQADPKNKCLRLRGEACATTSLSGGIPGTGSVRITPSQS